jgi:hypothetical protein
LAIATVARLIVQKPVLFSIVVTKAVNILSDEPALKALPESVMCPILLVIRLSHVSIHAFIPLPSFALSLIYNAPALFCVALSNLIYPAPGSASVVELVSIV